MLQQSSTLNRTPACCRGAPWARVGGSSKTGLAAGKIAGRVGGMKSVVPPIVVVALTIAPPASRTADEPMGLVEVFAPIVREAPEQFAVPIQEAKQGSLHVFLPESCIVEDDFDLLIHFHGAPPVFAKALSATGMNAAIAVENLGTISGDYDGRYLHSATFDALRNRVIGLVNSACSGNHHPRRIALSAWSAGYAAVKDVLSDRDRAAQIDAVLLADGLHAAFVDPFHRELAPNALWQFVDFAREAQAGEKLMVITHSEIATPGYASTTETTTFLLKQVGVERHSATKPGPLDGMVQLSEAADGNLVVRGFAGGNEAAHAQHLRGAQYTLLTPLQEYWESTPPPITRATNPDAAPINVQVEVNDDEVCTLVGTYVECRSAD